MFTTIDECRQYVREAEEARERENAAAVERGYPENQSLFPHDSRYFLAKNAVEIVDGTLDLQDAVQEMEGCEDTAELVTELLALISQ